MRVLATASERLGVALPYLPFGDAASNRPRNGKAGKMPPRSSRSLGSSSDSNSSVADTLQAANDTAKRMLGHIRGILNVGKTTGNLALVGWLRAGQTRVDFVLERLQSLEDELTSCEDWPERVWRKFSVAQKADVVQLSYVSAESMHRAVIELAELLTEQARIFAEHSCVDADWDEEEALSRPWPELRPLWPSIQRGLKGFRSDDFVKASVVLVSEFARTISVLPDKPTSEPTDGGEVTPEETELPECLVTLKQAAAMVNRSNRTLERLKERKGFPRPEVLGGGSKPHEYAWSEMRPFLEKEYKRSLPETFPAQRFRPT